MHDICKNLNEILAQIASVEKKAGHDEGQARLIVVSKTFSADEIRPLLDHGWRRFGENRVQEAQSKWVELKRDFPDVELHLIGPLQSNKTALAVELFDVVHSVDREKIAKTLAGEIANQKKPVSLRVQVNTGLEPQKAGIDPKNCANFLNWCREEVGLDIEGLMCIPPAQENPGPHFALLRKLAEAAGLKELSMGMSSDYELAVEFGATEVRVGSAIFGARV